MKNQNKREKPEPGNPVPSEKQTQQRVREFSQAPNSLPRDLNDWLHTEHEFKIGETSSTTI